MVCPRCIMSVEGLLKQQKIPFLSVGLGEVNISKALSADQITKLDSGLKELGFELLNDPASRTIEKIKTLLIGKVQDGIEEHFSLQKYLSSNVFKEYSSVSKLFSLVEGITIEQYFILQKIEKAKELLTYNEMALSEIAFRLGYSSTQHLSTQFRKVTGMTPTYFRGLGSGLRRPIDSVK